MIHILYRQFLFWCKKIINMIKIRNFLQFSNLQFSTFGLMIFQSTATIGTGQFSLFSTSNFTSSTLLTDFKVELELCFSFTGSNSSSSSRNSIFLKKFVTFSKSLSLLAWLVSNSSEQLTTRIGTSWKGGVFGG